MPQLTNRQRYLLELLNQLSRNSNTDNDEQNANFSIDFPELNLDLGSINFGGESSTSPTPPPPNDPTTVREVLLTLVNEQVEVTTPFGAVTGTLIAVRDDYIVLVDSGEQVLVRIEKIELVNEL